MALVNAEPTPSAISRLNPAYPVEGARDATMDLDMDIDLGPLPDPETIEPVRFITYQFQYA
jgi:hypothetical protein